MHAHESVHFSTNDSIHCYSSSVTGKTNITVLPSPVRSVGSHSSSLHVRRHASNSRYWLHRRCSKFSKSPWR